MSLVEQIRQVATSRHALGEVGALLRELLSELGSAHAGRPWPEDRPSRERGAREERS
ncbi:MAG: hypothetical protein MUC68_07335 [Burkholderiaceae bacterium]|jgi:hypothetical protein|nr:hypothetical protein [Burkholderiaceae bacterium]